MSDITKKLIGYNILFNKYQRIINVYFMTMHFLTSKSEKLKTVLSTLTEAYKDGLQVKKEGNLHEKFIMK